MKLTDYDRTVIAETLAARAKELSTTSGDIRKAARESVYQTATDALAGHATADAIEKEAARLRELSTLFTTRPVLVLNQPGTTRPRLVQ